MSQIMEGKILQTQKLNSFAEGYNLGYEEGLKDAIKHTDVIEKRDNGYDYPDTKWVCANCGEEVYPDDCNYCDMCGYKIDGEKIPIPESDCKLCIWSETGVRADCHWAIDGSCKHDQEPHWIEVEGCDNIEYECSKCHKHNYDQSKYCPDCGSRMRII